MLASELLLDGRTFSKSIQNIVLHMARF
jgi:hypothetical protein